MITCRWMGRLGNVMFQIATVYAFALKNNDVPKFRWQPYFDLPKLDEDHSSIYVQPDGNNQILNIKYKKNLCLIGFFQRYEFFNEYKEMLIKEVFKVPEDWQPNTICMHVRRGDFLNNLADFPTQPDSYYMTALEKLDYKNKQVVICTDDIDYCKKNFNFADIRENTQPLDDIFFGANCESVVMSNSTFSFWMSYLSLKDRKIYFPLNWFNVKSGRTGYEICPKNWIGL